MMTIVVKDIILLVDLGCPRSVWVNFRFLLLSPLILLARVDSAVSATSAAAAAAAAADAAAAISALSTPTPSSIDVKMTGR